LVEVGLRCWSVCLGLGTGCLMVEVAKRLPIVVHSGWLLNRSVVPPPGMEILAVSSNVMLVVGWVETLSCCLLNWPIQVVYVFCTEYSSFQYSD
jgi:hypothetical protein